MRDNTDQSATKGIKKAPNELESIGLALGVLDSHANLIGVNPWAKSLLSVFHVLGKHAHLPLALEVWLSEWTDKQRKQLRKDLEKGQLIEFDLRQQGQLIRFRLQPLPDGGERWVLSLQDRGKERDRIRGELLALQKELQLQRAELNRWLRWLSRWPDALWIVDSRLQGVVATPAFRTLSGLKRNQWEGEGALSVFQQPEWSGLYQAATRCSVDRKPREVNLTLKEKLLKAYCHPLVDGLLIRLEPQNEDSHTRLLADALWKVPGTGLLLDAEGKVLASSAQAPQLWYRLFGIAPQPGDNLWGQISRPVQLRLRRLWGRLNEGQYLSLTSVREDGIWHHRAIPVLSEPLQLEQVLVWTYPASEKDGEWNLVRAVLENGGLGMSLSLRDGKGHMWWQSAQERLLGVLNKLEKQDTEPGPAIQQSLSVDGRQFQIWRQSVRLARKQMAEWAVAVDVTDRQQVEAQIAGYFSLFRSLFNSSPDGLFLTQGQPPKVIEVNTAGLQLLGRTQAQVLKKPLHELLGHPRQDLEAGIDMPLRGGGSSGEERWVTADTVTLENGQHLTRLVDITERRELYHRIVLAQELERKRIAEDLHDSLGQLLGATRLGYSELLRQPELMQDTQRLQAVDELLGECATELRTIASNLLPISLRDFGLAHALKVLQSRVDRMTRGREPECIVQLSGEPRRLPHDVEVNLFRIAQEAVSNCLKHAGASQLLLWLQFSETSVELQVRDDGPGFAVEEALQARRGLGLDNMQMRAALARAALTLRSDEEGTRVRVVWHGTEPAPPAGERGFNP